MVLFNVQFLYALDPLPPCDRSSARDCGGMSRPTGSRAHESAQHEGFERSWVHADLRRKEADQGNAAYRYSRGGEVPLPGSS
jgi:hypothetical protein